MLKLKTVTLVAITLAVILGTGYGLFCFVHFLFSGIFSLEANLAAAIIATATTVIVSVFGIVINQRQTKKREIAESHRPQKIELYKQFMDNVVIKILHMTKKEGAKFIDKKDVKKELESFFFQFTGDLIVWGSPKVIKAYTNFRNIGEQPQILLKVDDMLRAIRQDLGHNNRGIKKGDLIGLFLTDPEKLRELIDTRKPV